MVSSPLTMLGGTSQQSKYIQAIEWILYFGLCGLSAFFMHGVLEKFFSGKTSFTLSEESVKELPTFMLCFSNSNLSNIEYEYGTDFKIKFQTSYRNSYPYVFLKEGGNSTLLGETIRLEKITTMYLGNCYKIA